ncbi:MAG TPA: hypothetical protein PKA13_21590 [Geminicoccaceae bacterium]|nr:hypothetical protein [Geminicoccus sp.]HMU52388.1 hypothetical protein [Geminicoccaceae bacterium]
MIGRITDPDAFLQSLFNPLPADKEQPDSKAFLDEIDKETLAFWRDGIDRATQLDTAIGDLRSVAARAKEMGWRVSLAEADRWLFRELIKVMDGLMRRPSADMSCVDFKRRHMGWNGGYPGWVEALAADEARVRPGGRLRRLVEPGKATEARP